MKKESHETSSYTDNEDNPSNIEKERGAVMIIQWYTNHLKDSSEQTNLNCQLV